MADLRVDQLSVYPVKSLGGVRVESFDVSRRGPDLDRRWALVDEAGVALTQREYPILSQCRVAIKGSSFVIDRHGSTVKLPARMEAGRTRRVKIWSDEVQAIEGPSHASSWFTSLLGSSVMPVFMPDRSARRVDSFFAPDPAFTTFTDGFPLLVASMASLEDLNSRMERSVPIGRFRPNVVVTGGEPFAEDYWGKVAVGGAVIRGVKPCKRCVIATINPESGTKAKEPLKTLASFRRWGTSVFFAENFVIESPGKIRVGDSFDVLSLRSEAEVARSRL